MLSLDSPYPFFTDKSGDPLDGGFLFVGEVAQNPETNPVTVYWDEAQTQPAAQPLRTLSGLIVRNGTPARVYVQGDDFSLTVKDKRGVVLFYERAVSSVSTLRDLFNDFVADLADSSDAAKGPGLVGYAPGLDYPDESPGTYLNALPILPALAPYLASPNGSDACDTQFSDALLDAQTGYLGSSSRTILKCIELPAGVFKITQLLQVAAVSGAISLKFKGVGCGGTVILFDGATATISARSSAFITWEDITFRSSGIDDEQVAFTIAATGNPLRSWTFIQCGFEAFYKCFAVSGSVLCSEFSFYRCKFSDCYYLMDNDNNQAVNWNFVDCDWENSSMVTAKDKNEAAIFKLQQGTFSSWTGGSIVLHGMLAYFNLTASGSFLRSSHKIIFQGVRLELEDNGGSHAPLTNKRSVGYVTGSNAPTVTLRGFSILNRGTLPTTTTYFYVWDNCSLCLEDGETEGGKVIGILSSNTASLNADVRIVDVRGVAYEEDTTNRLNTHDQHNLLFVPDNGTAGSFPIIDQRNCGLSIVSTAQEKRMYVRGPTGSLPQGGTTVNLPSLPDHFTILNIFCHRFSAAAQSLTVELRDQADTTTYGSVALISTDATKTGYVGREVGFQIPSGTALMLKFTGTPEVVKGVVGLEYL